MLNKEKMAEMLATVATKAAKKACGSASLGGAHQVKEPQAVREFFKENGKKEKQ